eukprot:gnl/Chilomastix_caulleri/2262.p1 GENE.gnl/Chilomastix_caulleri/2262~~gnl/Chilomastix_caulleri/2262.p1  ORF type:complete len:89 (+),score=6.51 gnl/Chilomastix_caulleri/2262:141-407(+)
MDVSDKLRTMVRKEGGTDSASVSQSDSSAFNPLMELDLTRGQRARILKLLREKLDPGDVDGMDCLLKSSGYLRYLIGWHLRRKNKFDD